MLKSDNTFVPWRKAEPIDLLNLWIIRTARLNGSAFVFTLLPAGNRNFSGGKMVCASLKNFPADRLTSGDNYVVTCGKEVLPARVDKSDSSVWVENVL